MFEKGKIYFQRNSGHNSNCKENSKECFGAPYIVFGELEDKVLCSVVSQGEGEFPFKDDDELHVSS
jgi:hypothetical protein